MSVDSRVMNTLLGSDADYQACCTAIDDALQDCGATVTADTGQANTATIVRPGTINTYNGYKIYRLADTEQATRPAFLKVEFGQGGATTRFAIRLTLSSATNGAGTPSGIVGTALTIAPTSSGSGTLYTCVTEHGMRQSFNAASGPFTWMLERPYDPDGEVATEDVVLTATGPSNTTSRIDSAAAAGGTPVGMFFNIGDAFHPGSSGGDVMFVPLVFYRGKPKTLPILGSRTGDVAAGSTFAATVAGVAHTFLMSNATVTGLTGFLGMVYE